jgi:hypothetical protein
MLWLKGEIVTPMEPRTIASLVSPGLCELILSGYPVYLSYQSLTALGRHRRRGAEGVGRRHRNNKIVVCLYVWAKSKITVYYYHVESSFFSKCVL